MFSVQPRLPLGMPFRPRTRNVRRPFTPSFNDGPYRLPRDVRDRLTAALAPYRNRDAAFALATFLGRFWSMPVRIVDAFPIDRRELANHPALGLTEATVRGAIRVLEEVGFLDGAVERPAFRPRKEPLVNHKLRHPLSKRFRAVLGWQGQPASGGVCL
jgi:hypothetical protein